MMSNHPAADGLRASISIATLIGESVRLIPVGRDLRGQCPMHRDAARGLFVHEEAGLYRCFSCDRSGDVVQWTREINACGEEEAIAILQQRAATDD